KNGNRRSVRIQLSRQPEKRRGLNVRRGLKLSRESIAKRGVGICRSNATRRNSYCPARCYRISCAAGNQQARNAACRSRDLKCRDSVVSDSVANTNSALAGFAKNGFQKALLEFRSPHQPEARPEDAGLLIFVPAIRGNKSNRPPKDIAV